MTLDHDVVDRTAGEGARVVALSLLGEADEAAARLEAGTDPEALHDYRVALRRLRTTLRAYRPWLDGSVKRRHERRVRDAARSTNPARDAEVQLAWLREQEGALDGPRRPGLELLLERIGARAAGGEGSESILARHRKLAGKLRPRLEVYEGNLRADAVGPFGAALAALLREQLAAVRAGIEAISGPGDVETAHRARIEGKRLRYLLEPLRGNPHADSKGAVKDLKAVQDVLGELHDAHVLGDEIGKALVDAAAETARRVHEKVQGDARPAGPAPRRRSPRVGLLALDRMVRERRDGLFAALRAEVGRGRLGRISTDVEEIVSALERRAGGAVEIERKFLLSGVPPLVREREALEITQGWLPGERFRERVRRIRAAGAERYFRALKHGTGLRRLEAEEETARRVFDALWPLTEGRRVEKRRFRVEEGGLVWEIDEFTDRDLVIAEVELPPGAIDAALPAWLAPHVVREVTGDAGYLNENLGSGGGAVPARPAARDGGDAPEDGERGGANGASRAS